MVEAWGQLLERAQEIGRIESLLARVREGNGAVALIEGAAGIGKTSLLNAARELAAESGFGLLYARAGLLERDLPWNVVRQLFADVIGAEDRARERFLAGAGSLASPALGLADSDDRAEESGALHGLYWLTQALAADRPQLMAVDDVHWADLPSLQFLAYIGERVADLPLALMVTIRVGERRESYTQALQLHGVADRLSLRELSREATATLTREALGAAAADEFCAACHRATSGNPFMLHALLQELSADGRAPTAAAAAEVARITPESVKRSMLLRLSQLPSEAQELATTVALLGAETQLREAAEIAGLEQPTAAAAADALATAGILVPGAPLGFVHPLVREVIYDDVAPHERARRHREAAGKLIDMGAAVRRVALQLARTEPAADGWVVEQLREAARGALAEGAAQPAVQFLRRALAEPPPEDLRLAVFVELARAESLSGSVEAIEHLEAALRATEVPATYAATGAELILMLFRHGQMERAMEVAHEVIRRGTGDDRAHELRVIAAAATGAALVPSLRAEMEFFIGRIPDDLMGQTAEERLALSARLAAAIVTHAPMDVVADLAERALGGQMLLADLTSNELLYWNAASALVVAERFDAARASIEAAAMDARRRGSRIGFALSSAIRCLLDYRTGNVAEGVADGRHALATIGPEEFQVYTYVVAFLLDCLIEHGELDEALRLATGPEFEGRLPDVFAVQLFRVARARTRIEAGDAQAGVDELIEVSRTLVLGPATCPWRSRVAAGLIALGRRAEAVIFAEEELALARRTKSGWAQAVALQVLASADPERASDAYGEALELSERHGFALERARSQVMLGAHERRRGQRRLAEALLNEGLEVAVACGALALQDRARDELVAIGLTPRRRRSETSDTLTPAERRVVELAVEGLTNREIAQALFVSLRTVETHLTHCYQKLGIEGRGELASALREPGSSSR